MTNKQPPTIKGIEREFDEKFVEFAPDGSRWGAGLRIKHTGTTEDREILDDVKQFLQEKMEEILEYLGEFANKMEDDGDDYVVDYGRKLNKKIKAIRR